LNLCSSKKGLPNLDAVAGPDGEDATLLHKPFEPFKTSNELSKEKRKIIIGLPDVRFIFCLISYLSTE
jgi:hypothetical protein